MKKVPKMKNIVTKFIKDIYFKSRSIIQNIPGYK